MIVLNSRSVCHDDDSVGVDHSSQSVGDDKDRRRVVFHELLVHLELNEVVRLQIDVSPSFIEDLYFGS